MRHLLYKYLTCLICLAQFNFVTAQTDNLSKNKSSDRIKDYFLPPSNVNHVTFKSSQQAPGNNVDQWFLNDDGYILHIQVNSFYGTPNAIIRRWISFTDSEVILHKEISVHQNKSRTICCDPIAILIKPKGEISYGETITFPSAEWIIEDVPYSFRCSSTFTTVKIEGISKKAIIVEKRAINKSNDKSIESLLDILSTTEYYVHGIGLWKIEYKSGKLGQIQLSGQEFDPSATLRFKN